MLGLNEYENRNKFKTDKWRVGNKKISLVIKRRPSG